MHLLKALARLLCVGIFTGTLLLGVPAFNAGAASENFPELRPDKLVDLITKEGAGKVTIVSVFASWCPPCQEEMPMLIKMRNEYHTDQLQLIGISADEKKHNLEKFAKEYGINFPVYSESGQLLSMLRVDTIPHMFIFNKRGELVHSIVGLLSEDTLKNILSSLMSEGNV